MERQSSLFNSSIAVGQHNRAVEARSRPSQFAWSARTEAVR